MIPFFILISVFAFTCNGFGTRLFQTRFRNAAERLPLYQASFCLVSTLCFWALGGFALPSQETLLYGLAFGLLFCLAVSMSAKGYTLGSMALTSVTINMSLLLPILYSIIFWDETPTLLHGIGFLFFCGSVVASALSAKSASKKFNLLWLVVVLLGFLANGATAIIQKNYVLNSESLQDSVFLAVAYFTASLCFIALYIRKRLSTPQNDERFSPKPSDVIKFLAVAILAGAGSFGGNLLLGRLSAQVLAAILYPCINGGLAVCTTLLSFFFFKEKASPKKILSILLGCVAIVVLNLG